MGRSEAAVNHCACKAPALAARPAACSALTVPVTALGGNAGGHCQAAPVFLDIQDSLPNRAGCYPEEKQQAAALPT